MTFSLKSLLRSTTVLYLVFFLALVNFFSYIMAYNYNAVVVFLVLGVITRYLFSKNMIIILLVSLILTNVIMSVSFLRKTVEGMKNKKEGMKPKKGKEEGMKPKKGGNTSESFESRLNPESLDGSNYEDQEIDDMLEGNKEHKVDYASTLESAYDNLDKLLGSDAIRSMTEDTQRLAEKQKSLMGNIQKLEPMMNKAGDMLQGLDIGKMGDMLKGLEGKMGMFGGKKEKGSKQVTLTELSEIEGQ